MDPDLFKYFENVEPSYSNIRNIVRELKNNPKWVSKSFSDNFKVRLKTHLLTLEKENLRIALINNNYSI